MAKKKEKTYTGGQIRAIQEKMIARRDVLLGEIEGIVAATAGSLDDSVAIRDKAQALVTLLTDLDTIDLFIRSADRDGARSLPFRFSEYGMEE